MKTEKEPALKVETNYFHHLDALRSFAMLFGIFVHAGTLRDSQIFQGVAWVSDHFRMALFFTVSAMLATIVLRRRPATTYITRRTFTLVLPFIVTVTIFNPPTLELISRWQSLHPPINLLGSYEAMLNAGGRRLPEPYTWHLHLWFLLSLTIYSFVMPFILYFWKFRSEPINDRLRSLAPWARLCILLCLLLFLGVIQRVVYQAWLFILPEFWIARATLYYFPFVAMGIALMKFDQFHAAFLKVNPVLIAIGLAGILAELAISPDAGGVLTQSIALALKYVVTFSILQTMYAVAAKHFQNESSAVRILIEAIFTVYLVHYFVLYSLANAFSEKSMITDLGIIVISFATIMIGLTFHYFFVRPFWLTRMLFNGALPSRRAKLGTAATQETAANPVGREG